jgi:hypothetical protein
MDVGLSTIVLNLVACQHTCVDAWRGVGPDVFSHFIDGGHDVSDKLSFDPSGQKDRIQSQTRKQNII